MEISKYTQLICSALGAPIVDIELKDYISNYIEIAFMELKPQISTTDYMTIPYEPVIDLTDKGVYTVVSILKSTAGSSLISDETLLFNPLQSNSIISQSGSLDNLSSYVDAYVIQTLDKQILNTLHGGISGIDYVCKHQKLYVIQSGDISPEITIEYIPDYKSADQVTDPYWVNMLYRASLAHTKIALGRARGKFKPSSLSYELDSDTLLSEGNDELSDIRMKLDDSSDLLFPLD